MDRREFKKFAITQYVTRVPGSNRITATDICDDTSYFWDAEHEAGWKANYFCSLWITFQQLNSDYFWPWCDESLSRRPMHVRSDFVIREDIWGFATEEDLTVFLLRWA